MAARRVNLGEAWHPNVQLESPEREGGWLRLAALLEPEVVERLCTRCGGTRIYIPRTMRANTALSQALGSEVCRRVIAKSAG